MLEASALVAGRYRLRREVGRGGMGVVWCATHVALRQDVAIKFMLGETFAVEAGKRFLREARTAASIRHANVVSVLDFGTTGDGVPFIVMEWLEGSALDEWLTTTPPPSLGDFFAVADAVLAGLEAVHAAGIVHRDLKPQNIFVPRIGGPAAAKIVDFGVSRGGGPDLSVESGLTATGQIIGTPLYMPLEQLRGARNVDARSDLYALGVVLFEGLTGRPPYVSESLADLVLAIAASPAPGVSSLRPDLGDHLDATIGQAIEREPDQRYQTAQEMRSALATALTERLRRTHIASAIETSPTTPGTAGRPVPAPSLIVVPPVSEGAVETTTPPAPRPKRTRLIATATSVAIALGAIAAWRVANENPGGQSADVVSTQGPVDEPVTLELTGLPAGAQVMVDGVETTLPVSVRRSPPSHRIEVHAAGFESWESDVEISGPTSLAVPLRPAAAPVPSLQADEEPASPPPATHVRVRRPRAISGRDDAPRESVTPAEEHGPPNPYRSDPPVPLRSGELPTDPGF